MENQPAPKPPRDPRLATFYPSEEPSSLPRPAAPAAPKQGVPTSPFNRERVEIVRGGQKPFEPIFKQAIERAKQPLQRRQHVFHPARPINPPGAKRAEAPAPKVVDRTIKLTEEPTPVVEEAPGETQISPGGAVVSEIPEQELAIGGAILSQGLGGPEQPTAELIPDRTTHIPETGEIGNVIKRIQQVYRSDKLTPEEKSEHAHKLILEAGNLLTITELANKNANSQQVSRLENIQNSLERTTITQDVIEDLVIRQPVEMARLFQNAEPVVQSAYTEFQNALQTYQTAKNDPTKKEAMPDVFNEYLRKQREFRDIVDSQARIDYDEENIAYDGYKASEKALANFFTNQDPFAPTEGIPPVTILLAKHNQAHIALLGEEIKTLKRYEAYFNPLLRDAKLKVVYDHFYTEPNLNPTKTPMPASSRLRRLGQAIERVAETMIIPPKPGIGSYNPLPNWGGIRLENATDEEVQKLYPPKKEKEAIDQVQTRVIDRLQTDTSASSRIVDHLLKLPPGFDQARDTWPSAKLTAFLTGLPDDLRERFIAAIDYQHVSEVRNAIWRHEDNVKQVPSVIEQTFRDVDSFLAQAISTFSNPAQNPNPEPPQAATREPIPSLNDQDILLRAQSAITNPRPAQPIPVRPPIRLLSRTNSAEPARIPNTKKWWQKGPFAPKNPAPQRQRNTFETRASTGAVLTSETQRVAHLLSQLGDNEALVRRALTKALTDHPELTPAEALRKIQLREL